MQEIKDVLEPGQLDNFLNTFPIIRYYIRRYSNSFETAENEDLAQEVKLSLFSWKKKRSDRKYSLDEWLKIARRATRNEINDYQSKKIARQFSLSEMDDEQVCHHSQGKRLITQLEGNTTLELHLLVSKMWEVIKNQSFFENYALLLKNDELFSHLIFYRGCKRIELAEQLQLTEGELDEIIRQLPLSDNQISEFLDKRFQIKAIPTTIRKWRQRATDELHLAVNGKQKTNVNAKPSGNGKT
jgi:hypothetical protein